MDDLPAKNKRRAMRRKRNLIAREVKMNKAYHPKVISPKRRRQKVTIKQVEDFLANYET